MEYRILYTITSVHVWLNAQIEINSGGQWTVLEVD